MILRIVGFLALASCAPDAHHPSFIFIGRAAAAARAAPANMMPCCCCCCPFLLELARSMDATVESHVIPL